MTSIKSYLTKQAKDKSNPFRFYVYAYIRSKDSETAKAGTPYYIGKGTGDRAWANHGYLHIPKDANNIQILKCDLLEIDALDIEKYNISLYGKKFNNTGILHNMSDSGHSNSGLVIVKDHIGNTSAVDINDTRYLSGELVSVLKNMVTVKDINGNTSQVSINDPRYLSGELVPTRKGTLNAKDMNGNVSQVSKYDPRYLSGELISTQSGQVNVIDKNGNKYHISVNDPRYLSGEFFSPNIGKINVRDIYKQITFRTLVSDMKTNKNLIHASKKYVYAKDMNDLTCKVSTVDSRWTIGELTLIVDFKNS